MFRIIDRISLPGGLKNEDLIHFDTNNVLLLDGSTGLSSDAPDACRFVSEFTDRFLRLISQTGDLCFSVNHALKLLYEQFRQEHPVFSDGLIFPSASAVIAHLSGDRLRIFNIGDCTTVVYGKEKNTVLYSDQVDRFDHEVIAEMLCLRKETHADIADIVKSDGIKRMLMENRRKMNTPDGYEILSFNMPECTPAHLFTVDANDVLQIVMFTDGFKRLERELADPARPPLSVLGARLRREEQEDASMNAHPRFKVSDDASAVIFEIC